MLIRRSGTTGVPFWAFPLGTLVVLLLATAVGEYQLSVLTRALILGLLALSVNLAWGYTGIFTIGNAVFFGAGAYTVALLNTRHGVSQLLVLLPLALVAGAAAALVLGLFLFGRRRVSEMYVALVTLAVGYVATLAFNGWSAVGAANGISDIAYGLIGPLQVGGGRPIYLLAVLVFVLGLVITTWLAGSQFGLVMKAVRDDEERAEFLGYPRARVQVLVFTFSGAMAGLAGGTFAMEEGFAAPTMMNVSMSIMALLYVILGGRGTLIGPILGVGLLEVAGRAVQDRFPTQWPIIISALLVLCVLVLPRGLAGVAGRLRRPTGPRDTSGSEVSHA